MLKKICLFILTFILGLTLSSCSLLGLDINFDRFKDPLKIYDFYDEGDFVFAYNEFAGGKERTYLYGLSDEGKKKECVILPKEYNGKKINGFGAELPYFWGGSYYKDDFDSSALKKIFIDFELMQVYDNWFYIGGQNSNDGTNPNVNRNKYTFIVWHNFDTKILNDFYFITEICVIGNNLLNNEEMKKFIYYPSYGIANVSYIYNYDEAPNDGYYWVDNYDNSLIEYIPPEPKREGYTFDGWYKEVECINKWDFNSDKSSSSYVYYEEPNEASTEEYKEFYNDYISSHTYVETKLYAKWVWNETICYSFKSY